MILDMLEPTQILGIVLGLSALFVVTPWLLMFWPGKGAFW